MRSIHPQYITTEDGKKIAVVISVEEYENLMQDIADLSAVIGRKSELLVEHEDLINELRKDGLLADSGNNLSPK